MARVASWRDLSQSLKAAELWIDKCLIHDQSVFTNEHLWTPELIEEVKRAFVDHPDDGDGDFITKLKGQLRPASARAKQLAAEMLWALLLFPAKTTIKPRTKRAQVREIWQLSGQPLADGGFLTSDDVLDGIGSAGQGYNNYRWKELEYLIGLLRDLKARDPAERTRILGDYDAFVDWIETVPRDGKRQFKHMLRYFAFPDRVEHMSSNKHRRAILGAFGVAPQDEIRDWTDRQLDEGLQRLRAKLEQENPSAKLDFYDRAIRERWEQNENEEETEEEDSRALADGSRSAGPINLILYGPPGTGKTHALRQKYELYTDQPDAVDRDTWLHELLSNYGWRPVIVAALADLKRPAKVREIRDHPWTVAKAEERGRQLATVTQTIWGYLQEHTPESVTTVRSAGRRAPFVFTKSESSEWELLDDWREQDTEAADLLRSLQAGPTGKRDPVRRYRTVTFHPSFTYEDFVRGIRPISLGDDSPTQFRLVDGIFKQICDEARANPSKRYALFIDEINRANIAKVFGELITLIEPDKRIQVDAKGRVTGGMLVQLPGGGEGDSVEAPFGVPANLDIYGTMNTADRSIALLDIALRRRFEFQEMEPDYVQLQRSVGSVHLGRLLRRINDRLEYLLDRDRRIGHAYLMKAQTVDDLRHAFSVQLIPLLQEYFFDDLARVAMVLATAPTAPAFVDPQALSYDALFSASRADGLSQERKRFVVTAGRTWTEASFRGIYESVAAAADETEAV